MRVVACVRLSLALDCLHEPGTRPGQEPQEATVFDILDEYRRVFWKDMTLEVALREARAREPYLGAWLVVPATGLDYNAKAVA
ncbi:hypothetical protein SEA_EMOTION_65 [Arthrobacter phage Emotion]|uniref:Uncharacterized protein n=1 Tax=Arthrobacter phage Emotion TaxID=3038361 RepID=A0AA49IEN7_9CAUD|nr:hypothetical protein SEA_EMOTION_65 [Arthrobacter phage Emotion]